MIQRVKVGKVHTVHMGKWLTHVVTSPGVLLLCYFSELLAGKPHYLDADTLEVSFQKSKLPHDPPNANVSLSTSDMLFFHVLFVYHICKSLWKWNCE